MGAPSAPSISQQAQRLWLPTPNCKHARRRCAFKPLPCCIPGSAEHLKRSNLEAAKTLSRKDSFHPESTLPSQDRAELRDYARSGYDRGHMSPNGDMLDRSAQAESFSLANMVPQVHVNNAGVWAGIEGATRQLALNEGEVYVVSGPAFIGNDLQRIGNVLVPTHVWKVLYSPAQKKAGAYIVTNDETREYSAVSVTDLGKMIWHQPAAGLVPAGQGRRHGLAKAELAAGQ